MHQTRTSSSYNTIPRFNRLIAMEPSHCRHCLNCVKLLTHSKGLESASTKAVSPQGIHATSYDMSQIISHALLQINMEASLEITVARLHIELPAWLHSLAVARSWAAQHLNHHCHSGWRNQEDSESATRRWEEFDTMTAAALAVFAELIL